MSAIGAAVAQSDNARAFLMRKVEDASKELALQAVRIRIGDQYNARAVALRMSAVDEARQLLDAYDTNVARLLRAGAA